MTPTTFIGKGDVMISLSNSSTLKLRNVRYISKLKRNMISVSQLPNGGMKTTFNDDVCKIMNGALVMAYGKKKGNLCMMSGSEHQFQLLHRNWISEYGIGDLGI